MSEEKPKPPPGAGPAGPSGPPKLERVPAGYTPPRTVRPAAGPLPGPPSPRPSPPPGAGGGQATTTPGHDAPQAAPRGTAPRHVGADAAIAAGLPQQGSLANESALYLFGVAAAVRATGRLTFTMESGSFALSFRRGSVEHASSSDPADDLGPFLVRKGALRADALARANAVMRERGGAPKNERGFGASTDLAPTLIAERLVNPADVAAHLQDYGAQLVHRALVLEAGGWSWTPQVAPPAGAFPLGSPFAMLCAAVRTLDASSLTRRLGDSGHLAASRVGGRIRLEDLRLTPQEMRAAGLFDGSRSPAEIAAANSGEALVVLRLAVLLGAVELLSFGPPRKAATSPASPAPSPAQPARATPPRPAAAPRARPPEAAPPAPKHAAAKPPPTPSPRPPSAAAAPLTREALLGKLAAEDHFTVLGVKRDAPAAQIKAAYFQLARAYHPDAVPADAPEDVKKLCGDVFARVSEAWSALANDASRAAYLEKLKSGGTADVDVMNIFQAESVFQAGTLLVKARNYGEALRKFEEAMKLNPDEAEFGMWKAWCEFLLAADPKMKLGGASSAIEVGLKKNPRCAQGYLFLGRMAKLAGDLSLAERHLRRGLQVAPEHVELQRELKYLRK